MRLWLLCEVLFLLCLFAVPSLAAGGQMLAFGRAHHLRKADQIYTKERSSDQVPARREPPSSKLPLNSKNVLVPRTVVRRNAFCRPSSCASASGVNGNITSTSKGSAQTPLPKRGKWLCTLTSLVAAFLLYST